MNKNILYSTVILLSSLTFGACSSDDDNPKTDGYSVTTVSEAPSWQIDWQADDARPQWQEPDIQNYENWSIVKVQIEDALKPYTSTDDRLAVFVSGECRGVNGPAIDLGSQDANTTTYLLKAWGNESEGQQLSVTMKYYCARLKQVFTRSGTITYRSGYDIGVETDFIPQFTLGSSKYPVVMTYGADILLNRISVIPAAGDLIAAFVGSECRGVTQLTAVNPSLSLTVFGRTVGESVTVKYYQASTGKVFTFQNVAMTEIQ